MRDRRNYDERDARNEYRGREPIGSQRSEGSQTAARRYGADASRGGEQQGGYGDRSGFDYGPGGRPQARGAPRQGGDDWTRARPYESRDRGGYERDRSGYRGGDPGGDFGDYEGHYEGDFGGRGMSPGYGGVTGQYGGVTGEYGGEGGGSSYVGPTGSSYGGEGAYGERRWRNDDEYERQRGGMQGGGFGPPTGSTAFTSGYSSRHDQGRQQAGYRGARDDDWHGGPNRSGPRGQGGYQPEWQAGPARRNKGPKGWQRPDERIRDDVCERLMHEHGIDSSDISVSVASGVVTLEGTVPERWMKHRAEDVADHCSGVTDVENRLRVRSDSHELPNEFRGEQLSEPSRGGLLGRLFGFRAGSKLRDVMTRDVQTLGPDESVQKAAQRMNELDVGSMPVCDGRKLRGMITDRDIAVRVVAAGKKADQTKVSDAMTAHVHWCYEDDDVDDVLEKMGDLQIRRIPVVDRDHHLVGIVALGDFATRDTGHVEQALQQISEPSGGPSGGHRHSG